MNRFKRTISCILSMAMLTSTIMFSDVFAANLSLKVNPWYEYAVATWSDTGAGSYSVYYKKATDADSAYTQVDKELVRGTRADIPGLRANTTYDIKVVDNNGNTEVKSVKTAEYDRSGFAHFGYSEGVGAYNNDGTPKKDAAVVYVTNETKNTVTYAGKTGLVNIVKNQYSMENPLIVRIIGTIDTQQRGQNGFTGSEVQLNNLRDKVASDGYTNMMEATGAKNLTIEGIGENAEIKYWGMMFDTAESLEIRNLIFTGYAEDGFSSNYGKRIWLHNNQFNKGDVLYDFSEDQDKECGDGATDFSKSNANVTISYNFYNECHKTMLVSGSKTSDNDHFAIHHNYFYKVHQRCPFTRNTDFHYYNNYMKDCVTGVNGGIGTWMFAEANYLDNTPNYSITEHKANPNELGALYCKEGGVIKALNNVYVNSAVTNETTVTSRTAKIESTNNYANFDTDTSLFYYDSVNQVSDVMHLTSAEDAKKDVLAYTGTMTGKTSPLFVKNPTVYESGVVTTETTTQTTTKETTTQTTTKETTTQTTTKETTTQTTTKETTTQTTTKETTTESTTSQSVLYGDVDESGEITASDAARVLAYVLDSDSFVFSTKQLKSAEVTGDNTITASDAAQILSKVLDRDYIFAVEK